MVTTVEGDPPGQDGQGVEAGVLIPPEPLPELHHIVSARSHNHEFWGATYP